MDKKSGVYYYLTDNSLRPGGSSMFGGVVLMYTTKGEVGRLNTVTALDYRDRLGYDLAYNPNYAGLDTMLASVARLDVLRLNDEATVANLCWDSTGAVSSVTGADSPEAVEISNPQPAFWVSHKSPGDWGDRAIIFQKGDDARKEYTLFYYAYVDDQFTQVRRTTFSLDPVESDFYTNVNFGDLTIGFADKANPVIPLSFSDEPEFIVNPNYDPDVEPTIPNPDYDSVTNPGVPPTIPNPDYELKKDEFIPNPNYDPCNFCYAAGVSVSVTTDNLLRSGSNGLDFNSEVVFTAADVALRLSALEGSSANVLVMNGFHGGLGVSKIELAKAVVNYCGDRDISVFLDAESFVNDVDLLDAPSVVDWAGDLLSINGHYGQLSAVPDQMTTRAGTVLIQPSVYLFQIYARMFTNFGHVNFPPAGPSYGTVSASRLMESNFHLYGDELKTGRVNYLTSTRNGICMWEQRTLYSLGGSDLSHASTVFILRDLKYRLLDFMSQFTFRFSTPVDLLTIRSGLTMILDLFIRNNFLFWYDLRVPTYEEAQAAGRTMDIEIDVATTSDMQVINLMVALHNAANL